MKSVCNSWCLSTFVLVFSVYWSILVRQSQSEKASRFYGENVSLSWLTVNVEVDVVDVVNEREESKE